VLDQHSVAKLATMNPKLLRELSLEEVLSFHPLLDAQSFDYGKARKVKPIKARPINTILDKGEQSQSVWEKLLLATLEGSQPLKRGSVICWGVNDDVWQQTVKKLHDKYQPTEMDEDGWVTYVPKDTEDAVMNAHEVIASGGPLSASSLGPRGGFSIINPWWGDERVVSASVLAEKGIDPERCGLKSGDQVKLYLHYGVAGDWVLQNQKDPIDVYRIARSFFEATYEVEQIDNVRL